MLRVISQVSIIEYKGYRICQNTKTKYHRSKVSGHEWCELIPAKGFHVIGKGIFSNEIFYKVEKAKEKIDFVIKYQIGWE